MKQLTVAESLGVCARNAPNNDEALDVIDLFCGAGGFSTGAAAAGCNVILACDSDKEALETHRRNHPGSHHIVCKMPCDIPLPTTGRAYHIHGSPPCQKFSCVNRKGRRIDDTTDALELVKWYLEYALASPAASWSMEQVASPLVMQLVERIRLKNLGRMAYGVFNFKELGVPQMRKRLIAGSPELIAKLKRETEQQPVRSVRSVIEKCRGTHVRSSCVSICKRKVGTKWLYTRAGWNDFCHPVDAVAPTVVARHALVWVTPSGSSAWHDVMTVCELAALQTFPDSYKWPALKRKAYLQIGNAVPPRVAELMLRKELLRSSTPQLEPGSPVGTTAVQRNREVQGDICTRRGRTMPMTLPSTRPIDDAHSGALSGSTPVVLASPRLRNVDTKSETKPENALP